MRLRSIHRANVLELFTANVNSSLKLPYIPQGVSAGFPSPADDFLDLSIDLNKEFIKNPSSTFYARVNGESMKDAGINHGDLLIIDKSLNPIDGKIAVCYIDGEFTVKRIKKDQSSFWLMPENKKYQPIQVTEDNDFIVWGMVVHVIKSF